MSISVSVIGNPKEVNSIHVNVEGENKKVQSVWTNIEGNNKKIWPSWGSYDAVWVIGNDIYTGKKGLIYTCPEIPLDAFGSKNALEIVIPTMGLTYVIDFEGNLKYTVSKPLNVNKYLAATGNLGPGLFLNEVVLLFPSATLSNISYWDDSINNWYTINKTLNTGITDQLTSVLDFYIICNNISSNPVYLLDVSKRTIDLAPNIGSFSKITTMSPFGANSRKSSTLQSVTMPPNLSLIGGKNMIHMRSNNNILRGSTYTSTLPPVVYTSPAGTYPDVLYMVNTNTMKYLYTSFTYTTPKTTVLVGAYPPVTLAHIYDNQFNQATHIICSDNIHYYIYDGNGFTNTNVPQINLQEVDGSMTYSKTQKILYTNEKLYISTKNTVSSSPISFNIGNDLIGNVTNLGVYKID